MMSCLEIVLSKEVCLYITVNKNLVGGGYMTTDQKKKLLWGNKKATTTEEVSFDRYLIKA